MASASITVNVNTDPTIKLLKSLGDSFEAARVGSKQDCTDCGMPDEYAKGLEDGLAIARDALHAAAKALEVFKNG